MASHGGAGEDNPVSLNVAPMVDIIFCLCIFFMCSFTRNSKGSSSRGCRRTGVFTRSGRTSPWRKSV